MFSDGLKYSEVNFYTWRAPGNRGRKNLDFVQVKHEKEYKDCAEAAWGGYLFLEQIT
jgi:hypothetical protein